MNAGLRRIQKSALPSGLVLVHERTPSYPAAAFHLWINAGSAHENAQEAGSAHFLEHMLFKGTETYDAVELGEAVERLGGNMNAFTTFDYTAYHMVLSSRFWKEGLGLLTETVLRPKLDEEDMKMERQVILEEIREAEDAVDGLFSDRFFHDLYPGHGYGRPIFGTEKGICALRPHTVRSFYRRWYCPPNMVLAVAGDVEWHQLQDVLADTAPELTEKHSFADAGPVAEPAASAGRACTLLSRGHEERIVQLAFPIPGIRHADLPLLDLLSILLGEGAMSRFYRGVRLGKRLARDVSSSLFSPARSGRFLIRALPYREVEVPKLVEELMLQIRNLRQEGVSARELGHAKLQLDKELVFNDETVEGRARTLAYYESMLGSFEEEERYRDRVFAANERQIVDVARTYLDQTRAAVGVLVPAAEKPPEPDELFVAVEAASRRPAPRALPGRSDLHRWKLGNGIRAVYRRIPEVRVSSAYASAIGGLRSEDRGIAGISTLISRCLDRGSANRTDEKIAEEAIDLQAEVEGIAGIDSLGLKMDLVSANLLSALELFADILLNPQFEDEIVEQERRAVLRDLDAQRDYFEAAAGNLFLEQMFEGHPYGLNILGRPESLRSLEGEKLWKHYSTVVRPDRLVVGIVSHLEVGDLKEELEATLGTAAPEGEADWVRPSVPLLEKVKEIRRPIQGEKAYLCYGFRGAEQASPDRYALDVLTALLSSSGGGRLFVRLREELGLVYSVDAHAVHGLDAGYVSVSLNTDPDQADTVLQEVKEGLGRLTNEELSAEEVERVKHYLIGSYELDLQRSATQAAHLCLGELFGTDRELEDYVRGISGVTIRAVKDAARRYLNLERSVFVLLSPAVN